MANYYETLGIRPSASLAEIELAYKGRRSQYHPDRYTQTDVETVQWATEQMKLVTEAYRVLVDPSARARHDEALKEQQRSGSSPSNSQASAKPESSRGNDRSDRSRSSAHMEPESLQAFMLRSLASKAPNWKSFDRIYVAPHIPLNKLAKAISNYAPEERPNSILLLIDDTFWGGGGDGLLLTEDRLYSKTLGFERSIFEMSHWHHLSSRNNVIYAGTQELIKLYFPKPENTDLFISLLNEWAELQSRVSADDDEKDKPTGNGRQPHQEQDHESEQDQASSSRMSAEKLMEWRSALDRVEEKMEPIRDFLNRQEPNNRQEAQAIDDFNEGWQRYRTDIKRALHFNYLDLDRKRELLLANDLLVALHEFIEDGDEPLEQYINAAINDGEFIRMLKAFLKSVIEHAEQSGSRF
jgi:curved DNA-binding protein CbpA